MELRQQLQEIEELAKTLSNRAHELRRQMGDEEPVVEAQSLGHRLRRLRARKGWTQERLAMEAGVSVNGLIKIEHDETTKPRATTINRLARALEVDDSELEGR